MTCLLQFYHSDDMSGIDSDYDVFMCKGFLNADLHEIYPLILISGIFFFFLHLHGKRVWRERRRGERNTMELESVKRYLEKGGGGDDDKNKSTMEEMPTKFFERFIMQGLRVDLIEPGRVICSMKVPPRLLVSGNPHIHIHNTLSLSFRFHTDPHLSFRLYISVWLWWFWWGLLF